MAKISKREKTLLNSQNFWGVFQKISEAFWGSTFDLPLVFEKIFQITLPFFQAERLIFFSLSLDHHWKAEVVYPSSSSLQPLEEQFLHSQFKRVLRDGRGIYENILPENSSFQKVDLPPGLQSFLCVPLKKNLQFHNPKLCAPEEERAFPLGSRSKILGTFYADTSSKQILFSPLHQQFLQSLANYGAEMLIHSRLEEQTTRDPLTQLYLRPYFEILFREEIAFAKNKNFPLSLLMIDLDKFQKINQDLGHSKGDQVLGQAAKDILASVRATDICTRYGGDEFVILLPQTPLAEAEKVARNIQQNLQKSEVHLQISLGLTTYGSPKDTADKMIKRADQALYSAKRQGGNSMVTWAEEVEKTSLRTDRLAGIFTGQAPRDYRNISMLLELISKVSSTMELEKLFVLAVDMILEITTAERAILMILQEGQLKIHLARDRKKQTLSRVSQFSQSIPEKVLAEKRAICLTDTFESDEAPSHSVPRFKLRTLMCVPLIVKGEPRGVIYVDSRLKTREFTERDLAFLEALAGQMALSMEQVRLLEENIQKAQQLAESMEEVELLNKKLEVANRQLERKVLHQATELEQVRVTLEESRRALQTRFSYHNIIGKSQKMQELYSLLDRISHSSVSVLIYGKSGTGKELVAKAIHFNSPRKDRQIVSENCAAVSESLLESELFGHVKGAFTGAEQNKKGLFEYAHKGTLFLDEIGDMSLGMQTKLLRVLEEGKIRPLGTTEEISTDVRIIAATNKNLRELVREGTFREDLFYRLNVVTITLPPLCERREDVALLIDHFLEKISRETQRPKKRIHQEAQELLMHYDWPGNVRELENEIKKLVVFSDQIIQKDHLSPHICNQSPLARDLDIAYLQGMNLKDARCAFEAKFIVEQLERFSCNVSKTARELRITRQHLHRLIEQYKIPLNQMRKKL